MSRPRFGDVAPGLDPRHVAAVVLWLADPACPLTGEVLSAGGGRLARWMIGVSDGAWLEDSLPESVAAVWQQVCGDQEIIPLRDAMAEVDLVEQGRLSR